MDFKKVTHVIFDLDGTLMDSEKILNKIITDIVQSYGKKYTPEARAKVVGTPEKDTARIVVKETGLPITADQFLQIYNERMAKELQNVPLFPGAAELIKHFYYHGVPTALATSSSKFTLNIKAKHHQKLFSLFNHQVVGGSDPEVKYGKPAPDIFLICASRFEDNPKPQQCLVFEDAPNGVKAAKGAGMQVVMIPSNKFAPELTNQATLVLNSLQEFRPELFGLPPMKIIN